MKKVKMISMILIFCMLCSACGGTSEEVAPIHTDNTETNKLAPYLSITRSFYSEESESGMSSKCFIYDIEEKKLEQKGTVSYTSSHPLTLYSTRNDKIYYSAFSGKGKGNQIYLDNNGTGEKKTNQFCDFNYLIQCGEQYFMAAELLHHYCIEPIVCDAEFQNCSRVMFDKKDDRFTWMVSTVPKENKIVFSHYSDNEMREADDVEGGNAPSKIAMLDLETKKTETVYETKYYIDGIACEGKKLILSCAPNGVTTRQKHKIYEVNLDTKKSVRLKLPFYIMDQMALYDNILYFLGWKGDTRGIYAYNLTTKEYDVIMEEVEDEAFSSGALGQGVAILPSEGKLYAPCDGEVVTFFPTGHAIGMVSDGGAEILIHVGMDTVKLDGEGFTPKVAQGAKVKKGDLLLEFDIAKITGAGYSVLTPVIISNTADYADVVPTDAKKVAALDALITVL